MHDLVFEPQRLDALVVEARPGNRPAEITPLRRGLGRRKRLGTAVQRFPVGQPRTLFLHVHRVPPFLFGVHPGFAEIDGLAGGERRIHRLLAGGFPHFHRDVQIAGFEAGELRDVIRLHVFDVIAGFFQYLAHQRRRQVLPGPVMQGQLDRVFRLDRARRQGECRKHD